MAFREFTDSEGRVWRAWDVSAEQLHPATREEDFIGEFLHGWLAFESADERRRMPAPYPPDWDTLPLPQLEELCSKAPPVVHRSRNRTPSGEHRAFVAEADRAAIAEGQRTFSSPRGREWTVRRHECLAPDGAPMEVLRFTADDLVVDLQDYPADWHGSTPERFAMLLLDGYPPRRPERSGPQRRRDDRPLPTDVTKAADGGGVQATTA